MNSNDRLSQLESLLADALHRLDHVTAQINQLVDFQRQLIQNQQQLSSHQEQLVDSQRQLVDGQHLTNRILESTMEVFRVTDQRFRRVEEFLLKPDEPHPDPQP